MIEISIEKQKLKFIKNSKTVKEYAISTAKNGAGCKEESEQTPVGQHKICEKIGDGLAVGTVFQERNNTGIISKIYKERREYSYVDEGDCMTTRILRLEGLQEGVNRGEGVDTLKRCIYVHGTPYEYSIGRPFSHGCIRMRNKDIVELFELAEEGGEVFISGSAMMREKRIHELIEGVDFEYDELGRRVDPKENDLKYKDILHQAWLDAEASFEVPWKWPDFVIEIPKLQKKILKERYGIDYKTVEELNPDREFSLE